MSKYSYLIFIALVSLGACKSYEHLASTSATNLRIKSDQPDTALSTMIFPYKHGLDAQMNEVIAQCPEALIKDKPESGLTNWVADAIYRQSVKAFDQPIAFAFQNFGGIRIPSIGKGDVTVGKIYELMPFDNAQLLVQLSGKEVIKFLEFVASAGGAPVSSNVLMQIHDNQLLHASISGQPIDTLQSYFIAMPDYIANGGDNQSYLKDKPRIDKNILVRDLLINDAKESGTIIAKKDARITIE